MSSDILFRCGVRICCLAINARSTGVFFLKSFSLLSNFQIYIFPIKSRKKFQEWFQWRAPKTLRISPKQRFEMYKSYLVFQHPSDLTQLSDYHDGSDCRCTAMNHEIIGARCMVDAIKCKSNDLHPGRA